jgi:hypothetical protein
MTNVLDVSLESIFILGEFVVPGRTETRVKIDGHIATSGRRKQRKRKQEEKYE